MSWEPMTLGEYAEYQKSIGSNVLQVEGTWWTEVRPFFYRPLFPFTEVHPELRKYPRASVVGGVLHLVPPDAPANSHMNLFLYDDVKDYSLEKLGTKQRWIIKKGLANFTAKRITDVKEFIEEAYPLYRSFYGRTNYFYKKDRIDKQKFGMWAEAVFSSPKVVVTGAYCGDSVSAVDISYQVEDVIIDDVFFSDTESQRFKVTDFMVHTLRESAKSSNAKLIFRGFPSGKRSLDNSKLTRGCKVGKMPAYCKINPVALFFGRKLMERSFEKLLAITSPLHNAADVTSVLGEDELG